MNRPQSITRADVISSAVLFDNIGMRAQNKENNSARWSSDSSTCIIGRNRARWMERTTFLIEGFDKRMDYYVDLGDGHCKRILARKFHYQYDKAGSYEMTLYIKAGDNMLPVCQHKIQVENQSLTATLRSISLF